MFSAKQMWCTVVKILRGNYLENHQAKLQGQYCSRNSFSSADCDYYRCAGALYNANNIPNKLNADNCQ